MRIAGRFSFEGFPIGDRSRVHFPFVKHGLPFLDLVFRCGTVTGEVARRVERRAENRSSFLFRKGSDG